MSDEMTYADAMCQIGELEDKINGLADEFDTMGDEHDALKWYVAEMSLAMPSIVMTIRALAGAIDRIVEATGVKLDTQQYDPQVFAPPNRAARRRAQREHIDRAAAAFQKRNGADPA